MELVLTDTEVSEAKLADIIELITRKGGFDTEPHVELRLTRNVTMGIYEGSVGARFKVPFEGAGFVAPNGEQWLDIWITDGNLSMPIALRTFLSAYSGGRITVHVVIKDSWVSRATLIERVDRGIVNMAVVFIRDGERND